MCKEAHIATNLSLDPDLLDRAVEVSGERSKKAAVTRALEEFIARRGQKRLVDLMGKLEWDTSFDDKAEQSRGMTLLVDTSVWSLAFSRDQPPAVPQFAALRDALADDDVVATTGLVLQELFRGFVGFRARKDLIERFAALPLIGPDRQDHIEAAELRNTCRRAGIQVGTIDALLAQLRIGMS